MGLSIKKLANWKNFVLLLSAFALLFAFQNCGKAGFDGKDGASELEEAVDPKLAGLPFPYDISVNQIAYMSCPSTSTATSTGPLSATFTFKVGAYDNAGTPAASLGIKESGLKLNAGFLTAFDNAVKVYNADFKTPKLKEALMTIPASKNAQLQVAVRDPQAGIKNNLFGLGTEIQSSLIMDVLSLDPFAEAFSKNRNKSFNEFPAAGTVSQRALTASLTYPVKGGVTYDQYFRTDISNRYLVVGYVNPDTQLGNGGGPMAFGPDSKNDKMYGTGYQLRFGRPSLPLPINLPSYPQRALTSISEYDMKTNPPTQIQANWDCSLQFKIVKNDDRKKSVYFGPSTNNVHYTCFPETYEMQSTTTNLAILHLLRRFLPAEAWDINVTDRCIVPRAPNNFCYSGVTGDIVYDEYFFANPAQGTGQNANCGTATTKECAHYLTLCFRR